MNCLNPEPVTTGSGAHYVALFTSKAAAQAHRKALSAERRAGYIAHDVRHRVTRRVIKVDGASVVLWAVTERATEGSDNA
jgi:hypothetical protein